MAVSGDHSGKESQLWLETTCLKFCLIRILKGVSMAMQHLCMSAVQHSQNITYMSAAEIEGGQ